MTHTMSADELGAALSASLLPTEGARDLFVTLLRELTRGEPVSVATLAGATGWPIDRVRGALNEVSSIEFDTHGRVVGAGITLRPTPHVLEIDGRRLYTWCALDTLMFPPLLGKTARVFSRCAATRVPIHLRVSPTSVTEVQPSAAVVSLVLPDESSNVRSAFCNHSKFFASVSAAKPWLNDREGATVETVERAFHIRLHLGRSQFAGSKGSCC